MGERSALTAALAAFVLVTSIGTAHAENRQPALQVLNSLPVAAEVDGGYDRDLFRHWITGANGCTTRERVLQAEARSGTVRGCDVAGGSWVSRYDGVRTANPSRFDIDHMVPLNEAWQSGAWRWTNATREAFANDLGYAHSLVAVSASSNRSKSDRDPQEWLPGSSRCWYAASWIAVKYRWRLAVDAGEKRVLTKVLGRCPRLMTVPGLADREVDASADRPATTERAPASGGSTDPRFDTCGAANAAGYGPYVAGRDPEYDWYVDRDGDGRACEP